MAGLSVKGLRVSWRSEGCVLLPEAGGGVIVVVVERGAAGFFLKENFWRG